MLKTTALIYVTGQEMRLILEHVADALGVGQRHDGVQQREAEADQSLLVLLGQRGVLADPDAYAECDHKGLLVVQFWYRGQLVIFVGH